MEFSKNNSNRTRDTEDIYNMLEFQIAFFFFVIIATVLGNSLVLSAIFFDNRLRNVTNYFVCCLAVSDLLVACFSCTIRLHLYLKVSKLNIHVCRFWNWIDAFCEAASIFTLTVISIDRYYKISRPFHYQERMTKTVAIIVIVSIWMSAGVIATLGLIPYGDVKGVVLTSDGSCRNYNRVFYTMAAIVAFFLPLAVLIVMYSLIFRIALYHFKKTNAMTIVDPRSGKQLHYSAHKDLKATRTLFIVVSTFVICWGPFFTIFLILLYQPSIRTVWGTKTYTLIVVIFVSILPSSNSFFNPIIYACFDKVYRRSFRKILFKLVGRSEQLGQAVATFDTYTGQRATRRSRSLFEMSVTQPRESITNIVKTPDSLNNKNDEENGKAHGRLPSETMNYKETDVMLEYEK